MYVSYLFLKYILSFACFSTNNMKKSKSHIVQRTKTFELMNFTPSSTMPALSSNFDSNIMEGVKDNTPTSNISKQQSIVVYKGFRSAVSYYYFDLLLLLLSFRCIIGRFAKMIHIIICGYSELQLFSLIRHKICKLYINRLYALLKSLSRLAE